MSDTLQSVLALSDMQWPELMYFVNINLVGWCRGFLNVSKIALERAVDSIFADDGMRGLGHALFVHKEWLSGVTTESFLLTLEDYITDLNEWLDPPFFKRAVQVRSTHAGVPIWCYLNRVCSLTHVLLRAAVLEEHGEGVLQGIP